MWRFQNLETYTGLVRTGSLDAHRPSADLWQLGVEPTV